LRILMVGPAHQVAMQRHMDWALRQDAQVCVADRQVGSIGGLPHRCLTADLFSGQTHWFTHSRPHRSGRIARLIASLRLRRLVATWKPHLVHSYKLGFHTEVCMCAGVHPLLISVWGSLNSLLMAGPRASDRRWIRQIEQYGAAVLVESPLLMSSLAGFLGGSTLLESIPLGVDGELFRPLGRDKAAMWRYMLDIPDDATVLLSPRGWSEVYQQREIVEALALASRQVSHPLVLVFVSLGRSRNAEVYAQAVLERASHLDVGHALRWTPELPHTEMPGLYALADIVINFPSQDAFPSTLLEAAACARPIVSSQLPAYRDTYIERFCTLVAPLDAQSLANAIVNTLSLPDEMRQRQAWNAREAVLRDYSQARSEQRLARLYQDISENAFAAT